MTPSNKDSRVPRWIDAGVLSELLRLGGPCLIGTWLVVAAFGTIRRGGDLAAFSEYLTSDTHLQWLLPLMGLALFVVLCRLFRLPLRRKSP